MAGHSKWATTKHRKAAQDKKRSALFSKLTRNIYVAAKSGDANPDNNAALATAIAKAKASSLPKDKIDAAIAKAHGTGADGKVWDEIIYEGYGPDGVALYVEALTDNRNRTVADVRSSFSKHGGNLGTSGSVAFQFEREGDDFVAKAPWAVEISTAKRVMRLIEALEELDDVQAVYHTMELSDDVRAELEADDE
ncbi:MAG: YebC/PmpR family DNA-binding transcriptional regulator [Coriobacteriia bacterium]|nr:YebC/PmpR family DNA-binding transcriptional regulator [Coriobacteriia bacterium]